MTPFLLGMFDLMFTSNAVGGESTKDYDPGPFHSRGHSDDDQLRSLGSPERSIMSPKGTSLTKIAPFHDVATISWLIGRLRLAPAGQMLQPPEQWPQCPPWSKKFTKSGLPSRQSDDDDQD
jgi:hypothetical protein